MIQVAFLQLPVPPPSAFATTGNVPLAAGSLAAALESERKIDNLTTEIIPPEITDTAGDEELISLLVKKDLNFLGISLYLWNSERSLYIADEVKKRNPRTKVILGGPEVNSDNAPLLVNASFDYALVGESEHIFPKLLDTIIHKKNLENFPNLLYSKSGSLFCSTEENAEFPLARYPSPYLKNILNVEPQRSTYIETVRGCRSECSYCFYPKSSKNLRMIDLMETGKLINELKDKGAKELVFLDPTFNHRPAFESLLDLLIDINKDKQLKMFAELRPEGLTDKLIKKLKKANFYKIEIGLQSVNLETLRRVKRYGNPFKVIEVSKKLRDEGIELLLDLMVGLPGDTPEDVMAGIELFRSNGLEEWVQTFIVSALPGTNLRQSATEEKINYMPLPPYRVISTEKFSENEIVKTYLQAEEKLGRRLDEYPRPLLTKNDNLNNDVIEIDIDNIKEMEIFNKLKIGKRHTAIHFVSNNYYNKFEIISKIIYKKISIDPYCTLDIVLFVKREFPLNLIDEIKKIFRESIQSYQSIILSHRGEDYQRRITCVIDFGVVLNRQWVLALSEMVSVFKNIEMGDVFKKRQRFMIDKTGLRITGDEITETDWRKLKRYDPELISFESRNLEKKWNDEVLGYGE